MIKEYISEMEALGRSQASIDSVKYTMQKLEKFKPLDKITKDDLLQFFKNFEGTDNTKRLYMGQIKKFYKYCKKDELIDWIRLPKVREKRMEVLTIEDINKLIEATINPYWKAYISFAFETGARFGEIQALKWKDIPDCIVANIMTEKTNAGLRRIPLRMSNTYLMNLKLQINATKDDIIFPLSECRTLQVLNEIAKNASIDKHVHPHAFRHACATYLVEKGTQEALIRKWCGWTPTSPMIARYQHLADDILINNTDKKVVGEIKPAENKIGELQSKILIMEDINTDNQKKIETLMLALKKLEAHIINYHPEDTEVYEVKL